MRSKDKRFKRYIKSVRREKIKQYEFDFGPYTELDKAKSMRNLAGRVQPIQY